MFRSIVHNYHYYFNLRIVSTTTLDGRRSLVLSRPIHGDHYSFDTDNVNLNFISAIGSNPDFAYHAKKTSETIFLLPEDEGASACICAHKPAPFGQAKGSLIYTPNNSTFDPGERGESTTIHFNNLCAPPPRGDLYTQRNPTCDIRTYTGGQIACHHMFSLLDADQPIPWPDQPVK